MRRRRSASTTAVALVVLAGCDSGARGDETTTTTVPPTTTTIVPGGASPFGEPPPSSTPRPTTTRPATNPCRNYDGTGFVGHVSVDESGTRVLATEGSQAGSGAEASTAPECEVIGPPVGIDARIGNEWIALAVEPGPVEMGPGGPVPIAGAVHPIWLPRCDGSATTADRLRLRLDGEVTLVIEPVTQFDDDVEFVVGCDGELGTVGVGRVMTFRGYG